MYNEKNQTQVVIHQIESTCSDCHGPIKPFSKQYNEILKDFISEIEYNDFIDEINNSMISCLSINMIYGFTIVFVILSLISFFIIFQSDFYVWQSSIILLILLCCSQCGLLIFFKVSHDYSLNRIKSIIDYYNLEYKQKNMNFNLLTKQFQFGKRLFINYYIEISLPISNIVLSEY